MFAQIELLYAIPAGACSIWGVVVVAGVLGYGVSKVRRVVG
jgi:hypothetical protein